MPFEVYADGIDLVIFEEFRAGEQALHLIDQASRNAIFSVPDYRLSFRKDYDRQLSPRVWHRNFDDAEIVAVPDASLVGKSFGQLARLNQEHPVDTCLDLVMTHGDKLRWRTTIANHRPEKLANSVTHPSVHVGFSDAGAHLRNMGLYNFPLHLLRWATDKNPLGKPVMRPEQAVRRVTGELASWLGIDADAIRVGDRADLAIINPNALDGRLDGYHEAPIEVFDGLIRQGRKNNRTLSHTIVNGQIVYTVDAFSTQLGQQRFGRFLRRSHARLRLKNAPNLSVTD